MKVLVIGGSGNISRQIVFEALCCGHEVSVFNRGQRQADLPEEVRRITGDRFDYATFEQQMARETFDAVIDMIAFTEQDVASLMRAFGGRVSHVIVTSSIACYARPFHRNPPIPEEGNDYVSDPTDTYGYNKARLELFLMEQARTSHETAISIVRPSLTFGRGGKNFGIFRQNFGVVQRIRNGKPLVMFGDGQTPMYFSFTPDVARGYVAMLGNPKTFGQVYHINSMEYCTWDDLYLILGKVLGKEPQIVHIATELLYAAAPKMNGHLYLDKQWMNLYDSSKARRDFGFEPQMTVADGLRWMVEWFDSGHDCEIKEDLEKFEDELVALAGKWRQEIAGKLA